MFGRDEVADSLEDGFETFAVDPSIDCVQVEDLHEGLPLGCFYGVFVLTGFLVS